MEYTEKLRWLNRYRGTVAEIRRLEEEIDRWRSLAEKMTPSYMQTPGDHGGDRIPETVERLVECTEKRQQELEKLCELREEIGDAIGAVQDERLSRLLKLRYIDGLRIEQIAVQEHIEYRWTRRLLRRGVEILTPQSPLSPMI